MIKLDDFRSANIPLETSFRWLSGYVVSSEIKIGIYEKFASSKLGNVIITTICGAII